MKNPAVDPQEAAYWWTRKVEEEKVEKIGEKIPEVGFQDGKKLETGKERLRTKTVALKKIGGKFLVNMKKREKKRKLEIGIV